MESTATIERGVSESPALWPTILQAFVGALIVGDQVQLRWGTSDLYGKFMGIAILIGLVLNPSIELWRRRSGRNVRFNNLAVSGYALVWVTAGVFARHLH